MELWTDGACSRNPGPGGWAWVHVGADGQRSEGSGGEAQTTNNRMELTAVIEGLRSLTEPCRIEIVTDSAYVEQPFTLGWIRGWERRGWKRAPIRGSGGQPQELKNADLWQALLVEVRSHMVTWRRVRGHVGHELNERCDALAVAATLAAGGNRSQMIELDRARAFSRKPRTARATPSDLRIFKASDLEAPERKRYGFES